MCQAGHIIWAKIPPSHVTRRMHSPGGAPAGGALGGPGWSWVAVCMSLANSCAVFARTYKHDQKRAPGGAWPGRAAQAWVVLGGFYGRFYSRYINVKTRVNVLTCNSSYDTLLKIFFSSINPKNHPANASLRGKTARYPSTQKPPSQPPSHPAKPPSPSNPPPGRARASWRQHAPGARQPAKTTQDSAQKPPRISPARPAARTPKTHAPELLGQAAQQTNKAVRMSRARTRPASWRASSFAVV